jgi:hypothetical protein
MQAHTGGQQQQQQQQALPPCTNAPHCCCSSRRSLSCVFAFVDALLLPPTRSCSSWYACTHQRIQSNTCPTRPPSPPVQHHLLTIFTRARDQKFSQYISHDYLNDPRNCPAPVNGPLRTLLADDEPDYKPTYFLQQAGAWTAGSIVGGLALGVFSIYLFRHKPHGMVGMSIGLQVSTRHAAG